MVLFTSIRAKASLLFFVLFVVIILPVNLIIYQKVRSVLEEASEQEMTWEATKLLDQVKLDPITVPLSAKYDIQLMFTRPPQHEIIFSSPGFPALLPGDILPGYVRFDTLEILHADKATESANGTLLLISLSRSAHALDEQLKDLKLYLFLASSASIALCGILVYLAAGWMLRPIYRISQAASRIQAAKSIERVPVPNTKDESRKLAEAINAMLARIEKTIKTQTNFFASASHELKTPLAIMKAELTADGSGNNKQKLESLLTEVERLDHIIGDFLLISQLKSDSLIIRRKMESVEEIVYRALQKVTYLKVRHNPKIAITLEGTDYTASVDADKMETVFINLIENAIRYANPTALILVVNGSADNLEIEIANPVHEAIVDIHLLTQEFRKSRELSVGLGMGLWICEQILKLHQGSLTLSSVDHHFVVRMVLPRK